MDFLREHFPERLILLRGDLEWPPWSPDLSPFNYFLWSYLKSKVYIDKLRTLEALSEIERIPRAMLERSMDGFATRLQDCLDKNGCHLTDVIFRS